MSNQKPTLSALPNINADKTTWLKALKERRDLASWALTNKNDTEKTNARKALVGFCAEVPSQFQDLTDLATADVSALDLNGWDERIKKMQNNDAEYRRIADQLKSARTN